MSEESIHIEEEMEGAANGHKKSWTEEIQVGSDELVGKVQELLREAAVRKITIKDEHGKKLLSIPMYAGVAGMLVLGPWSALALVAAWVGKFSILIERAGDEPAEEEAAAAETADDLTALKGVGPTFARRMHEAGITTFKAVANTSPQELADIANVTETQASGWIEQAREFIG